MAAARWRAPRPVAGFVLPLQVGGYGRTDGRPSHPQQPPLERRALSTRGSGPPAVRDPFRSGVPTPCRARLRPGRWGVGGAGPGARHRVQPVGLWLGQRAPARRPPGRLARAGRGDAGVRPLRAARRLPADRQGCKAGGRAGRHHRAPRGVRCRLRQRSPTRCTRRATASSTTRCAKRWRGRRGTRRCCSQGVPPAWRWRVSSPTCVQGVSLRVAGCVDPTEYWPFWQCADEPSFRS